MIRTSVIGFPRIGEKRELKQATEDYFAGKITHESFYSRAAQLRKSHWLLQKEKGIDLIPSNDFSLYDGMLDTIIMLNAVPKRYREAGLRDDELYFAMAKGFQKGKTDLKAMDMKKWFNTNYHYIVPEIEKGAEFSLGSDKVFTEYAESLASGVRTKPVIIGPFTFLRLSRKEPGTIDKRLVTSAAAVYAEVFRTLSSLRCDLVQMDEPALVLDLTEDDVSLFDALYRQILRAKGPVKVLLQTYFGDIRDVWKAAARLDFDLIGLDFIEGARNIGLLKQSPFPMEKQLVAGVVNGKNVWVNDFGRTLPLLDEIKKNVASGEIIIGTSCSLLHVPYSTRHETALPEQYRRHLAFAEEKLDEQKSIASILDRSSGDYASDPDFRENQAIIKEKKDLKEFYSQEARDRVASLGERDFSRGAEFHDRITRQRRSLDLPALPTTTIGSFPQTADVRKIRSDYRKEAITGEQYEAAIKDKIKGVIALQEEIGLDVLVHGEFERNDMVEYFGENLSGFLFTENGWVQSYGTRGVKPPVIFGDVTRPRPITVPWIAYAQGLTAKPVKGMLTGPVTILNWSFPREDLSLKEIAFQIALAIRDEVADLENAGIKIIQVDEAALREKLPLRKENWQKDYLDWAIKAFRLASSPVRPETQIQTHMCYSEFSDIMESIKDMDADVLLIEAARSDFSVLDSLRVHSYDKDVGPGVYDIHSPRVPGEEEMTGMISLMTGKFDARSLWVNPDCGLKTRTFEETVPSLANMVKAAKRVREMIVR